MMDIDNECEGLEKKGKSILYREKEINFIKNFMGPSHSTPYPCLFIYGHTASGKTMVMSSLLEKLSLPHVWLNCHEYSSSTLLFSSIIKSLSDTDDDHRKINNIFEFIEVLKRKLCKKEETTYIVLDCAEVLRKEDPFILSILTKLQQLTNANICTVMISELPWMKFVSQQTSFHPIYLHFNNYTKNHMTDILKQDCPPDYDKSFYEGYVNVIMKTFFTVTRNLTELRHLAEVNFDKYCEPLDEDSEFEVSNLRLWKNIEPTLKDAMSSVYLREISGSKWRSIKLESPSNNVKQSLTSSAKYCVTRELPFYSKFLLIAAYFASYNPPKSDFKHFVKNQGKQSKKRVSRKMEKNRHLLGPRPFSLDRMLSIFFSIVGEKVLPSALIFSQISSLVSMRLVSRVSADEQLDCPKYKCLAELDLVAKIGKTVGIDVMGYLDDFL